MFLFSSPSFLPPLPVSPLRASVPARCSLEPMSASTPKSGGEVSCCCARRPPSPSSALRTSDPRGRARPLRRSARSVRPG
eukprot:11097308-Alexandrium_andersonii.AAC.1